MATAVSISIRREKALEALSANAAGIGDSFPELPALDLSRKNKDNEIEQVSILERVAEHLRLVQKALIAAENESVLAAEAEHVEAERISTAKSFNSAHKKPTGKR